MAFMGRSEGTRSGSAGMVGFWIRVALSIMGPVPGVQNDQGHRRTRRIGYLR